MGNRWSAGQANAWYEQQPWYVGANYIPASAINQLEMWQAGTFDAEAIERELGWAAGVGMNAMRVFLHDLLWTDDPGGMAERMDAFLALASGHGIRTLFVFFDDCWHEGAKLGPQPAPIPGRHNSGWLQSPGHSIVGDEQQYPRLEAYIRDVVTRFADDPRVLGWDVYNEPTNGFLPAQGLPPAERQSALTEAIRLRAERKPAHLRLVELSFQWARGAAPSQPITGGAYMGDRELNSLLFEQSDIISFHNYESVERLEDLIARLKQHGRPMLCTEFMARTRGSDFQAQLPIFKREKIGCFNWGLVNGKTQTHLPWTPEPGNDAWFHDIFRPDGTPYDPSETDLIREMTRQ